MLNLPPTYIQYKSRKKYLLLFLIEVHLYCIFGMREIELFMHQQEDG